MAQHGTEGGDDAGGGEGGPGAPSAGVVTLEVSQQPYVSAERGEEGGTRMCAVVTVTVALPTAGEGEPAPAPPARAEVLLLDCSASMGHPREKLWAAQEAAAEAIRALPDGTYFAVVAGRHTAELVYPAGPLASAAPVRADVTTRKEAQDAVERLAPSGGTAIGSWLALARALFGRRPGPAVRHALLLSDGRNEHERPDALAAELAACSGLFTCDAIGVGEDWDPDELHLVAGRLDGRADAVRDLDALPGRFRSVTAESTARSVTGLRLRLTHRAGSAPLTVRQVHPTRRDLLPEGLAVDDRCVEFRTPPWGSETREYLVCVAASRAPRDPVDRDLWLADVKIVRVPEEDAPEEDAPEEDAPDAPHEGGQNGAAPEEAVPTGAVREGSAQAVPHEEVQEGSTPRQGAPLLPPARPVLVHWTRRRDLYSAYDAKVAHYAHHDALVRGLEAGRAALRAGDAQGARAAWGEAVRRAHAMGNEPMLQRLGDVVRIIDAAGGEVEIRPDIRPLDINSAMVLRAHSTMLPRRPQAPREPRDGDA
ncbi:VWA domain-containing protein [Streptomyces sp. NPDC054887]